jgi:hypothetical protein
MPVSPRPQRNPIWLRRRALLYAWWLESLNRGTRKGLSWQRTTAVLVALGLMGWLVTFWGPSVLVSVGRHLFSAGIVMALQSALLTNRGRGKWEDFYSQSWLASVPLDLQARKTIVALRSCCPPAAILLGFLAVLLLTGMFAHVSRAAIFSAAGACAVGTLGGVLVGWWLPQRDREMPFAASSLVHGKTGHVGALSAMSGWPLMQARIWLRPRSVARLMIVALGLPMDVSANIAVAILWIFTVGLYLVVLLRATIEVAGQGAQWLRPTPLSFARFAWTVIRYPMLKQLLWTAATAGMAIALGLDPLKALSLAELWVAIFAAVSSVALAHAYESRAMHLKILLSVCFLAAIETVKHHVALPCALLFSGWQLNRAARS